jgi:hypothetical protein
MDAISMLEKKKPALLHPPGADVLVEIPDHLRQVITTHNCLCSVDGIHRNEQFLLIFANQSSFKCAGISIIKSALSC